MKTQYTVDKNDPQHIYVNLNITNQTQHYQPATITLNTADSIVDCPNKYHLAIARFSLNTNIIPIFVFPEPNDFTNATDKTSLMSICLSYNNVDYPCALTYVPYYPTPTLGAPNTGVYSYQYFIDLINSAFNTATQALVTANPGLVTTPPYLTYDSSSQLISFNYETRYLTNNATPIRIYMSTALFTMFDNVKIVYLGLAQPNGKDYQLIVENTGNNYISALLPQTYFVANVSTPVTAPLGTAVPGFFMRQETSNLYLWNDFRGIVFSTTGTPVQKEFLPVNNSITSSSVSNAYRSILTDFEIEQTAPVNQRGYQQYQAITYRKIDLNKCDPLRTIDMDVFWNDFDGNLYPIYIKPHDTFSIKILFIDKNIVI